MPPRPLISVALAAAVAAMLAVSPAQGEGHPSQGPLDLQLPRALILGEEREVEVSVATRADDVRWFASAGSLTPVGERDGRRVVRYRPPVERYPQRVVIAALSDDGTLDWGVVSLLGRPTVETETTPGADVTVEVAGERFGPVRADARGRATLTVTVPPGITTASVHASDGRSAPTTKPLPLGTPRRPTLAAICNSTTLAVVALDADGRPTESKPTLSASGGELGPTKRLENGLFRATYELPRGQSAASFELAAAMDEQTARCRLERTAVPVVSTPPPAIAQVPQERAWFGIGLQGGVHTNFGAIVAPLVTAQLTARLPVLDDGLLLGVDGGLLVQQSSGPDRMQGEDVSMTLLGGPLTARLAYELPVPTITPYLVAQGGLMIVTSRLESATAGAMEDTQVVPTFGGGAGAWTRLGPGQALLEARYAHAELDGALVMGLLGGLAVTGGYRVEL